ncbi:MAG: hypothetical protein ACRCUQ_04440 [Alphaproteobacteria bacterium]
MGQKYTYLLGGALALYLGDNAWSGGTEESVPSAPRPPIQDMGPDHIPLRRSHSDTTGTPPPLDTQMPPPPTVPIHGMRPPPESVSEQPVPEAYRIVPDRRID